MDINKQELDRHITGNYGEDQFFKEIKEADLELLAEDMFEAWIDEHKKHWPEIYSGTHPAKTPLWEEMNDKLKRCWIAAAKCAMDKYIS